MVESFEFQQTIDPVASNQIAETVLALAEAVETMNTRLDMQERILNKVPNSNQQPDGLQNGHSSQTTIPPHTSTRPRPPIPPPRSVASPMLQSRSFIPAPKPQSVV